MWVLFIQKKPPKKVTKVRVLSSTYHDKVLDDNEGDNAASKIKGDDIISRIHTAL